MASARLLTLSFFRTARDARVSRKSLLWLYGGKLIRNVVVAWEGSVPRASLRKTLLGCLRAEPDAGGTPAPIDASACCASRAIRAALSSTPSSRSNA